MKCADGVLRKERSVEETILRRTWAEIDLDALEHNYRTARAMVGPSIKYLGVVKADAYGHGAVQVSRKLEALGADYLAVSSLEEARELQENNGGFIKTMWCGDVACENRMKEEAGMTSRCIPFRQEHLDDACPVCGRPAQKMIYWGISY